MLPHTLDVQILWVLVFTLRKCLSGSFKEGILMTSHAVPLAWRIIRVPTKDGISWVPSVPSVPSFLSHVPSRESDSCPEEDYEYADRTFYRATFLPKLSIDSCRHKGTPAAANPAYCSWVTESLIIYKSIATSRPFAVSSMLQQLGIQFQRYTP